MTAILLAAAVLVAGPELLAGRTRRRSAGPVAPRALPRRPTSAPGPTDPPSRLVAATALAPQLLVVAGLLAGSSLRSPAMVVAGAAGGASIVAARRLRGRRAAQQVDAGLPRLLEDLARHLRAGGSVRSGLEQLVDAPEHRMLLGGVGPSLEGGQEVMTALDRWVSASPHGGRRLAFAAVALGAEAGGPQARALDSVAATLRERAAVVQESRALTAQARASAALLAVAPVGFGVLGAAAQPDAAHFLLREPAGAACLVLGLALQGAGWWWMHRVSEIRP